MSTASPAAQRNDEVIPRISRQFNEEGDSSKQPQQPGALQDQQQEEHQEQQQEHQCCTPGPIYSSSGLHTFVHCPNLCKTCSGLARMEHPFLVCAWNNGHGMVEQVLDVPSPGAAAAGDDRSDELKESEDDLEKQMQQRTCFTCDIRCTNVEQLKEHLRGKRHQRQIYLRACSANLQQQPPPPPQDDPELDVQSQDEDSALLPPCRKRRALSGMQHYASTSQQQQDGAILLNSSESRRKFMRLGGQVHNCEVCNVICTSWGVLEDHFESKRHVAKVKHLQGLAKCGDEQACSRLEAFQGQIRILQSHYR